MRMVRGLLLKSRSEWPTFCLILSCYALILAVTAYGSWLGPFAVIGLLAPLIALHSSLQHEVLHGHPLMSQRASDALVFPAVGLFVPYLRFKDLHLAHHYDPALTDPYDDPESNYCDPARWERLPPMMRILLTFNNTLIGRMLLGPVHSLGVLYWSDGRAICRRKLCQSELGRGEPGWGERRLAQAYGLHLLGLVPVFLWLGIFSTSPLWCYVAASYLAMSLLKIRTYLEHRAHQRSGARSVIIEDRGPLALLFLNNNYHAVHHAYPKLVWHRLPARFDQRRDDFLKRNGGYRFGSYAEIFGRYFLRCKDPVAHPLMGDRVTAVNHPSEGPHARKPAHV